MFWRRSWVAQAPLFGPAARRQQTLGRISHELRSRFCWTSSRVRCRMSADSNITVYVRLLEEGVEVCRPTEALQIATGVYELLPT